MKKVVSLISMLSLLGSALVLSSCSLFGIRVDEYHFPDRGLRNAVSGYVDTDNNDYLSKEELENSKILPVWGPCYDLSGVEYLTNLETIGFNECYDLSGIEKLTNLKELDISNTCPDLSAIEGLTNLEEISIENCVFSDTFVFDNEVPVNGLIFWDCVFEKGFVLNNDYVEYVKFGSNGYRTCEASGDFVLTDCDALYEFNADFESEQGQNCNIDLSECDNLDWFLISIETEQTITSVDLSNCSKLRSFSIYEFNKLNSVNKTEITINISGSPNIESVVLSESINELDISDCPNLISASEQTPSEKDFGGLIYESDNGYIDTANEQLVFIK